MPDGERTNLEIATARLEEKLDAMKSRLDRVEGALIAVALVVIGAIVKNWSG